MRLDRKVLPGLIAALVALLLISLETADAHRKAVSSEVDPVARPQVDDPIPDLERRLAALDPAPTLASLRDPFRFEDERTAVRVLSKARRQADPPRPAPDPVLTAIIWDNDPRASIRWNGRDYIVKVNSQVSDYKVVTIGREQVRLAHAEESLVLRLQGKGR